MKTRKIYAVVGTAEGEGIIVIGKDGGAQIPLVAMDEANIPLLKKIMQDLPNMENSDGQHGQVILAEFTYSKTLETL